MSEIIVVGSSGHAKVVIDILQSEGRHRISGLLDRFRNIGEKTLGYEVLGREEDLPQPVRTRDIEGVLPLFGTFPE